MDSPPAAAPPIVMTGPGVPHWAPGAFLVGVSALCQVLGPRAPATLVSAIVQTGIALGVLGFWALALGRRDGLRSRPVTVSFAWNPKQLVQIAAQSTVLCYWALYFPGVAARWPFLLLQLGFTLAADFVCNWAFRGRLTAGSAVLPIVISINFFLWFDASNFGEGLAVFALAVLSKGLWRWKHDPERHIFNPSAIAVAIAGVYYFLSGKDTFIALDGFLGLPPNMAEVVMLAGLLVQVAYDTGFTTLAALWTILIANLVTPVTGIHQPSPFQVQTLIGITLFITDPKTTPRRALGRTLFGMTFGFLFVAWYLFSGWLMGNESYFTKVFAIPFANLLVPALERLAARLPERFSVFRWSPSPRLITLSAAASILISFVAVYTPVEKCRHLEDRDKQEFKLRAAPPFLKPSPDGRSISCRDNPIYGRPFSFVSEFAAWTHRSASE